MKLTLLSRPILSVIQRLRAAASAVRGSSRASTALTGAEAIDSIIAAGTAVRGDVFFSGTLRVDGIVDGRIESGGDRALLVVGESAHLRGNISAVDAVVCGLVEGNIVVQRYLELRPGSRVIGDVTYIRIEMHVGAQIDGRLVPVDDNLFPVDSVAFS
jgi:cytoskeletal protein CcmA (bactofilin family)